MSWRRGSPSSADRLAELFHASLGQTPNDYLQGFRIEQAKILLRDANNKIEDIARAVGYRDVRSFYRVFQKHARAPMKQFRP